MRTLIGTQLARRMNYTGAGTTKYGLSEFAAVCRVIKSKRLCMYVYIGLYSSLTVSRSLGITSQRRFSSVPC